MERLEFGYPNTQEKSSRRRSKRKWREIESLKERYRLQKELEDIDASFIFEDSELDF